MSKSGNEKINQRSVILRANVPCSWPLMADTLYMVAVQTKIRDLWDETMSAPFESAFRAE